MNKLYFALLFFFVSATIWSQSPQKMSYQAVIRNSSNTLMPSTIVGMQISIIQGATSGTPVYVETQRQTTNANGLVSLEIGSGTIVTGVFSAINWANGPYFIKTETDITGGTNYSISGVTELNSVPYALFAANSTPGPQGPAGTDGRIGATGPIGPAGPQGIAGNDGSIGATGPIGPVGPQGIAGNDGSTGATGSIGPAGPQGIAGNDGSIGATGPIGPAGPQGIAGNDGNNIIPIFLTKSSDYTIQNSDITGELYIAITGDNITVVTFTLPSAAAVGPGKKINFFAAVPTYPNKISITTSGSDSLFGLYCPQGTTSTSAVSGYKATTASLISDGIDKWYVYSLY